MKVRFSSAWLLPMVLFLAASLFGQTGRGTLTGTVRDPSDASVPRATVTITNAASGVKLQAETSVSGVYTIPEVPFGTYTAKVSATGFQGATSTNLVVSANQVTRFDAMLTVGDVQQTVEVTADAVSLQQDTSAVQTNFSSKQMSELPLALGGFAARSPESFTFLTPGVTGDIFMSSTNGGQTFANSVLLDGGSAGRSWSPGNFDESAPSVEAIGEFTIKTNAFSAEYGRTGSSITSFALRSGSNQFHGSGYEFLRNPNLDAKGFDHNQNLTDRKNDFGGTFGGPISIPKIYNGKDKTFFFFSYEQFRTNLPYTGERRYPTALQQTGDFSELLRTQKIQIYDPETRQPFDGNIIPSSRFSSVSKYALQYLPKPNRVSPGTGLQDLFIDTIPTSVTQGLSTTVIDHNLTTNNRLHFSWSRRQNDRTRDPENLLPFNNPLTQGRMQDYNTNQWRSSLDSVITPRLINHLNLSYDRVRSTNGTVTNGLNFVKGSGLQGVANTHTPTMNIGGYTTLGNQELNSAFDNRYEIVNHLMYTVGNHSLKFGGDIRRALFNQRAQDNSAGTFNFNGIQTSSADGSGGDAFASFLLGAVGNSTTNFWYTTPGWRQLYTGIFAQDDWKVTRKLTLNLGLRWEVEIPRSETANRHSSLDPNLPNPAADGRPGALAFAGSGRTHFEHTQWQNFGPRIGFAYSAADKLVIRGGFGMYYNLLYYNDFGNGGTQGFNANPQFNSLDGRAPAFYWQNGFPQNFAKPPFTDPSALNGGGIDFFSPEAKPPNISSWNFGLERSIGKGTTVSAFYVGNKGTRLYRGKDIQQLQPGALKYGDLLTKQITDPAVTAAGFTSPYPAFVSNWGPGATLSRALRLYPQYENVGYVNNTDGNSTYHSLQMKGESRFNNGLTFLVAYTWSKFITNADSATSWNSAGLQNDWDTRNGKSVGRNDRPHVLATSFLYELPLGKGKKFINRPGALNKIVGGWQVNGIVRIQSGAPLELGADCPSLGTVRAGGCRPDFLLRGDYYGPGKDTVDPGARLPYLNAAAFTVPQTPYTYGGVSRTLGYVRGWRFHDENFSIFKNTSIREMVNLQFRVEAFNVFNSTLFNYPDTFVGQYDPSQPGKVRRNANFGYYSGQGNTSRTLQLGLKLQF